MSKNPVPYIEVEDTTTRRWTVTLDSDEIEQIVLDWFEKEAKPLKGAEIKMDWGGRLPHLTIHAEHRTDNRPKVEPAEGTDYGV